MNMKETNAIDFLLLSYFGITLCDSDERILDKVIDKAYRDAGSHVLSVADSEKPSRKNNASKCMKNSLEELPEDAEEYDAWHKDCVEKLYQSYEGCHYKDIKKKNSEETYNLEFTYGMAQKWLNMTMKYLYILSEIFDGNNGIRKSDICQKTERISEKLHVPLDSYIIKSAENLKVYAKNFKIDKWSKIDNYYDYMKYQEKIREKLNGKSPIDWECPAWITAAKAKIDKKSK